MLKQGVTVRSSGLLYRSEAAKMPLLAVDPATTPVPPALKDDASRKALISPAAALYLILPVGDGLQVLDAIIQLVSVHMVQVLWRFLSRVPLPDQPVSLVPHPVDANPPVVLDESASPVSDSNLTVGLDEPIQLAVLVRKKRPKALLGWEFKSPAPILPAWITRASQGEGTPSSGR